MLAKPLKSEKLLIVIQLQSVEATVAGKVSEARLSGLTLSDRKGNIY